MTEAKKRVTLIGTKMAKPGEEFIYVGSVPACEGCKVRKACHNLVEGRRYRVETIRQTTHTCAVFEEGARVVEVIEAPVVALIAGEMAIMNSRIVFEYPCNREECRSFDLCHPEGVNEKERYTITQILGSAPDECLRGRRNMKLVELLPF